MMKDFKISPDDARLTAYALGELQGTDRAEFEAALEKDPEARAIVEQTRKLAQDLSAALANEPEAEADGALLQEIIRAEETRTDSRVAEMPQYEGGRSKVLRFPQLYYIIGGLAAACFAVLIALHDQKPAVVTQYVEIDLNPNRDKAVATAAPESEPPTVPSVTDSAAPATAARPAESVAFNGPGEAAGTKAGATSVSPSPGLVEQVRSEIAGRKTADTAAAGSVTFAADAAKRTELAEAQSRMAENSAQRSAENAASDVSAARAAQATAAATAASARHEQVPPATAAARFPVAAGAGTDEVVQLSPFQVSASPGHYRGGSTLAGSRVANQPEKPTGMISLHSFGAAVGLNATAAGPARAAYDGGDFVSAAKTRLSWFSVPTDTGSYAEIQRAIEAGRLPDRDAVCIEELINRFPYHYPAPTRTGATAARPTTSLFAASLEVASAPWAPEHRLVRVGLRVTDTSTLGGSGAATAIAGKLSAQVEFNPARVESYRLIGYEKRKDAADRYAEEAPFADVHSGQSITALYEVVPAPGYMDATAIDDTNDSRYGPVHHLGYSPDYRNTADLLTLRVRYHELGASSERRVDIPLTDRGMKFAEASHDFKFAAAVAEFGMILRDSPHRGKATLRDVLAWAGDATSDRSDDPGGYRAKFLDLARRTQALLQ